MFEDIARFAFAGLLGAGAMSLFGIFPRLAGLPSVDLGQIVATKLIGIHIERDTRLGIVLHLLVGTALAVVYGTMVRGALPGLPFWVRGLMFGVIVWLVVMALVMPIVGEGPFGARLSRWVAPITLFLHVLYGTILGVVIR